MNLHIALPNGPVLTEVEKIEDYQGIKFFVHPSTGSAVARGRFRASEFSTGRALPLTEADTVDHVVRLACGIIDRAGPEKIKAAMAESPTVNP